MKHTVEIHRTEERMPELMQPVIVDRGSAIWNGKEWRWWSQHTLGPEIAMPVEWWSPLICDEQLPKPIAPVAPQDDPFRLRTHSDIYRAACGLQDRLGAQGRIEAVCYIRRYPEHRAPSLEFQLWYYPPTGEVELGTDGDPQLAYEMFERAMNRRFVVQPETVTVPAGLEAADGHTIEQETE